MMFTKETIPLTFRVSNPYQPTDQMVRPGLCLYSPLPMKKNMIAEIPRKIVSSEAVGNFNTQGIPTRKVPSSYPSLRQKKDHNIGVWDSEEHEKFMDALHLYGNDWLKIEEHIRTRTAVQIRSHCQKYFKTIKERKYRELKKSNMLGKKIFIVTREYRNVSNIVQKHPHELLIDRLPNTGKRKPKNLKQLKKAQTTKRGNYPPASQSYYYPNDPRLFAMGYPMNKIREPTELIAMKDGANQAISSGFYDLTLPKPQHDSLVDDIFKIKDPMREEEELPGKDAEEVEVEEPAIKVFLSTVKYND